MIGVLRTSNIAGGLHRLLCPAALLFGLLCLGWFASGPLAETITEMMVRMVVVVGIYIFVGNSGIISFGHIAFMAIGAYASAWLTCCTLPMIKPMYLPGLPEWLQNNAEPFWTGVLNASALAGIVALVVGAVLMRLSGIAASIATFGLLAVEFNVYSNWDSVTAGTSSVSNIPIAVDAAGASGFAVAAIAIAAIYQNSRYGILLKAVRDDEVAAKAAGIGVVGSRLIAFVLSAMIVGVGGALHGSFLGTLTVDTFYLQFTFLALSMLIVGGIQSLTGAILGVLLVTTATFVLRYLEGEGAAAWLHFRLPAGTQEVVLGAAMVAFMVLRPNGATNHFDLFRFVRRPLPKDR